VLAPRKLTGSRAAFGIQLFAARATGAVDALLLLSLFLQWFFDRTVVPNEPLTAWEYYRGVDLLLATCAGLGLAASLPALGRGPSAVLRAGPPAW